MNLTIQDQIQQAKLERINRIKEELEKIQDTNYVIRKFEKKSEFEIIKANLTELELFGRISSMKQGIPS